MGSTTVFMEGTGAAQPSEMLKFAHRDHAWIRLIEYLCQWSRYEEVNIPTMHGHLYVHVPKHRCLTNIPKSERRCEKQSLNCVSTLG